MGKRWSFKEWCWFGCVATLKMTLISLSAMHRSQVDMGCRAKLESATMRLPQNNIIKNLCQLGLGKILIRSLIIPIH